MTAKRAYVNISHTHQIKVTMSIQSLHFHFLFNSLPSKHDVSAVSSIMNLWQEVAPLSSPRFGVCAVADGSHLFVIGGSDATNQFLDIVERYDPRKKNIWDKVPSTYARRS